MSALKFFAIGDLVGRLSQASDDNRFDQVTRTVHDIYETKLSENPDQIVSSAEIKSIYSDVSNLNPESSFREYFEDVFQEEEDSTSSTIQEGSPFRLAGYEEDFRPTPIGVEKTDEQIIQDSSLPFLQEAAASVVNPQYHFNQFIRVAKFGKNSGIAHWTLSFDTRKGHASVSVPVVVANGEAVAPEFFYAPQNNVPNKLTQDNLKGYSFDPAIPENESITEATGFNNLGVNAFISEDINIKEGSTEEDMEISIGYSVPLDENMTSNVGTVKAGLTDAVEKAREYAGEIIGSDQQINYSGALDLEGNEISADAEVVSDAVVAFNILRNTKNGVRIATVPVSIKSNICTAETFYGEDSAEHKLNRESLEGYFAEKTASEDDTEEAFSNAFLASEATFNQLRKEMKVSIDTQKVARAKSCLTIIGKKFGDKALQAAGADFIEFTREATEARDNVKNCAGCAFFSNPGTTASVHKQAYCNKFSTDVTNVKRGSYSPKSCEKRDASITWDIENDEQYNGAISTHSIAMN